MATIVYSALTHHKDVPMASVQSVLDTAAAAGERLVPIDGNVVQRTALDGASHLFSFYTGTIVGEVINPAPGAAHSVHFNVPESGVAAIMTAEVAANRELVQRLMRYNGLDASAQHDLFFVVAT